MVTFSLEVDYKVFLSLQYYGQVVMKSKQTLKVVGCGGEKRMKKKVKIKTQNEKIIETEIYSTKHMKKQLLELGRNSVM